MRQGDGTRTIFVEAGELKATVAPVKDTQEELDYWLAGLRRMQQRYATGAPRSSPRLPIKDRPAATRPSSEKRSVMFVVMVLLAVMICDVAMHVVT